MLEAESSELRDKKAAVEANLDKTIDDTLVMLGQSFDQAVRQAHLLYNGPPPFGDFDINMMSSKVGWCLVERCRP